MSMGKPRLVYSKLLHADRPVALGTFDHPPTPIPDDPANDIERGPDLARAIATGRRQVRQTVILVGFAVAGAILGAALIAYGVL